MSKAGQNTFSGISHQADITIMVLLESLNDSNFQSVIVEGKDWEDFTLVFTNRHEDYEVKWHKDPLSYEEAHKIIQKELKKDIQEKDKLVVISRRFSKKFLDDYKFLKSGLFWWASLSGKPDKQNKVVKRLMKKGWSSREISFLVKTEIREIKSADKIRSKIEEYFALKEPFYLDKSDQFSLVARTFKKILEKGSVGGTITKKEFQEELAEFRRAIAEKSESFNPEVTIKNKLINIDPYLSSAKEFRKLDHARYLSPLSENRRLIFYIAKRLESSQFSLKQIAFFIEKILLKRHYANLGIRILTEKWKKGLAQPAYVISFVTKNYHNFTLSIDHDSALNMIVQIAEKDSANRFQKKIFTFLKKEILNPLAYQLEEDKNRNERGWQEKQLVSKIIEHYFEINDHKKPFIDFIFEYFDFTGDDFQHVTRTDPGIYVLLKKYIQLNFTRNFDEILSRILRQFQAKCSGRYEGYEWVGGGISQAGSHYSITDIGIVRMIFKPLFEEFHNNDQKLAWRFFEDRLLKKADRKVTKEHPLFLRRSLIGILLDRLEGSKLSKIEKEESLSYLTDILMTRKGIPSTHEVVFAQVRDRNFEKIGFDKVMYLLEQDTKKFETKNDPAGYPTNLFAIQSLIKLIEHGFQSARKFYLDLVKKPKFSEFDRFYDSFELLGVSKVFQNDPDFVLEVFTAIDLTSYLGNQDRDMTWDKSGTLKLLIETDWKEGKDRGKRLIDILLKEPSQPILEFIGNPIHHLLKIDPLKTYDLFSEYLRDKATFQNTFQTNEYTRQNFVWLAEALAKKKHYDKAKLIVEYCIDDPDPETNNKEESFNYHLKVKNGDSSMGISTVRGTVAWALQQFAMSENPDLMEYALVNTERLLDLNGNLACQLGYAEPDYYVRLQALVPLGQLVPFKRRQILEKNKKNLGVHVRSIALRLLDVVSNDCVNLKITPRPLIERMAHMFTYLLDLNTQEAVKVCSFFETQKEPHALPLFFYFAIFRKKNEENDDFDPGWFDEKIRKLAQSNNPLREHVSIEIFRFVQEGEKSPKARDNFEKVEKYFQILFEDYQEKVFEWIYRSIEIIVNWPDRYESTLKYLKRALKEEISFLKKEGAHKYLWHLSEDLIQTIKEKNIDDYLDVMELMVSEIDQNIHYASLISEIKYLRNFKVESDQQRNKVAKIVDRLKELYPDEFDMSELK